MDKEKEVLNKAAASDVSRALSTVLDTAVQRYRPVERRTIERFIRDLALEVLTQQPKK